MKVEIDVTLLDSVLHQILKDDLEMLEAGRPEDKKENKRIIKALKVLLEEWYNR